MKQIYITNISKSIVKIPEFISFFTYLKNKGFYLAFQVNIPIDFLISIFKFVAKLFQMKKQTGFPDDIQDFAKFELMIKAYFAEKLKTNPPQKSLIESWWKMYKADNCIWKANIQQKVCIKIKYKCTPDHSNCQFKNRNK
jgi:hypothetical protein